MKIILLCSLILVGCSKTVNFKNQPPVSPPTAPNPPAYQITYTLANHADQETLWTSPVRIRQNQILIPADIQDKFTTPLMNGNRVVVYLNGEPICSYLFYRSVLHKENCVEKIEVLSGDILQVYGVVNYYGITLKFNEM